MNHPWSRVIDSLIAERLIRDEDVARLQEVVVAVCVDPRADLEGHMVAHPRFQLTVAYFWNLLSSRRRTLSEELARRFATAHKALGASTGKRPTEAQVRSVLKHDADFLLTEEREGRMKYYEAQLNDLHEVLVLRARMLEQLSNNFRARDRQDRKDDLE